jgi:hypothetical protein
MRRPIKFLNRCRSRWRQRPLNPSETAATGRQTLWDARNEGRIIGRTELHMTPIEMIRVAFVRWFAFNGLLTLVVWAMSQ